MNNIVLEKVWTQNSPIVVDNLIGTTVTGESEAHTFKVRGVDAAQEPVAITGTITGKLLNANNDTVALTGSLSNGIASVTLTETCYAVPGRFIISIFATNADVTQCLYCGVGNVFRASSSSIAYPTDSLPDITSLMADLEDILDGWPADYSQIASDVNTLKTKVGTTPMGTTATTVTGAVKEINDDVGDLKSQTEDIDAKALSAYPTDTSTGDVASFPDGADNIPAKKTSVAITPVQDLHGQANPYPAGTNRNLLKVTNYGGGYNASIDTDLKINDPMPFTMTSDGYFDIAVNPGWRSRMFATDELSAGAYVIALYANTDNVRSSVYLADSTLKVKSVIYNQQASGWAINITVTASDGDRIAVCAGASVAGNIIVALQAESGSTSTSYVPFENICPISGHDTVIVTRTGFNQWDEEWELGNISSSTGQNDDINNCIRSKNYIPVLENTSYYFRIGISGSSLKKRFYNANKNYIGSGTISYYNNTFTTPSGAAFFRFSLQNDYGTTYNDDICVNFSDTSRNGQYEPYKGIQTISVNVKSLNNNTTVYGGTLTVNDDGTGALVVDRAIADIGSLNWSYNSDNGFFYTTDLRGTQQTIVSNNDVSDIICSIYGTVSLSNLSNGKIAEVAGTNSSIRVIDTRYTSASDFTTENTGKKIVYALIAPVIYTLTAPQVKTLLGANNVWSDAGQVTVDYRADTSLYVNKKITEAIANALNA